MIFSRIYLRTRYQLLITELPDLENLEAFVGIREVQVLRFSQWEG